MDPVVGYGCIRKSARLNNIRFFPFSERVDGFEAGTSSGVSRPPLPGRHTDLTRSIRRSCVCKRDWDSAPQICASTQFQLLSSVNSLATNA